MSVKTPSRAVKPYTLKTTLNPATPGGLEPQKRVIKVRKFPEPAPARIPIKVLDNSGDFGINPRTESAPRWLHSCATRQRYRW